MKNKVLSLFTLFSLGTVSVQPFTKADLTKVMKISSVIATTPNVVKLVNGKDDENIKYIGGASSAVYNFTSAAVEDCTHLERLNRFINAIITHKKYDSANQDPQKIQGSITQWNRSCATEVGVAVAFQFVKELCNEVGLRMVGLNQDRIVRRALRALCISSVEGGVDTLHKLISNWMDKEKPGLTKDLFDTFSQSFLTTVATVATNQIVGEFLVRECEDDDAADFSIQDILNFESKEN